MRWPALVLLVACAHEMPAYRPYPLHPSERSASGGPIEIRGAVAHPGLVPYAPGLTLRTLLRITSGPTGRARSFAKLHRGDDFYDLPLFSIINGEAPDLELAPGDQVSVPALGN